MKYIDIRNDEEINPDRIQFADGHDASCASYIGKPEFDGIGSPVRLLDGDGCGEQDVRKSDIPNLIKALQKAVELGWTR
jgi:hypothetical protein